jgi:hypothetical protein
MKTIIVKIQEEIYFEKFCANDHPRWVKNIENAKKYEEIKDAIKDHEKLIKLGWSVKLDIYRE